MIERVECPAHPKVLLDIDKRLAQTLSCRQKEICTVSRIGTNDFDECFCTHFFKPVSAEAICLRKMSCIQIGMADKPVRKSSMS